MFHTPAHHHSYPLAQPAQVEITGPAPQGPDFVLADHGSILVLTPMTQEAKDWAAEHLPADAQQWGRGVVIEPRYWPDIQVGIEDDGLDIG